MPLYPPASSIASVASVTSAQVENIFATTTGKVHICSINYGGIGDILDGSPVILNFQKPGGTPVYCTATIASTKGLSPIPGFMLPAGGLEVASNQTVECFVQVFYKLMDS